MTKPFPLPTGAAADLTAAHPVPGTTSRNGTHRDTNTRTKRGKKHMRRIQTKTLKRCSAVLAVLLLFLVGTVMADCDLAVTFGPKATYSNNTAIFANEPNTITFGVTNVGGSTCSDNTAALYASDGVSSPVAYEGIEDIDSGDFINVTMTDPTIRTSETTMTYRASVDSGTGDSNLGNNNATSASIAVVFNGYKGKMYWTNAGNMTTKHTYNLAHGNMVNYTQPSSYAGVGWTTRTETWTAANLPIPAGSTIEAALLYISYNWDTTSDGNPNIAATFNGQPLTLGTPYTDVKNFAPWGNYIYGLYPAIDVKNNFTANADNSLVMTPQTGNSNALYPSTLIVVYSNGNDTHKQIFLNEDADELLPRDVYGVSVAEATAYAPFSGMTIDTANVTKASLYSFAGSAGTNEGNLLWNGVTKASNAWQGSGSTASPFVYDFPSPTTDLKATGNEAGVQGTQSGGMLAIQQMLFVNYTASA